MSISTNSPSTCWPMGRFDVRLATGERAWQVEPDPFDPLPVCSPGMLTGEDGLTVVEPPAAYPVSVSPVLVDDAGHELDITGRVRSVFEVVFGDDADGWWSDVGVALGARGADGLPTTTTGHRACVTQYSLTEEPSKHPSRLNVARCYPIRACRSNRTYRGRVCQPVPDDRDGLVESRRLLCAELRGWVSTRRRQRATWRR